MVIFENLKQLENARVKMMKAKPELDLIMFGCYKVYGSKGNEYQVTCKIDGSGKRLVFCSCEEKFPRKLNHACYHIAAALSLHLYLCEGRCLAFGFKGDEAYWLKKL